MNMLMPVTRLITFCMPKYLIALSFFLVVSGLAAQDADQSNSFKKQNDIVLGLGFQTHVIHDELASNLNYDGIGFSTQVTKTTIRKYAIDNVKLGYGNFSLASDINSNVFSGFNLLLSYNYLWSVIRKNENRQWLYLGPEIRFTGRQRDLEQLGNPFENNELIGSLGLNVLVNKTFQNGNTLRSGVYTSAISYLNSRKFVGTYRETVLWLDRLVDYEFHVAFFKRGNEHVSLYSAYFFNYYQANRVSKVAIGNHSFLFGFVIHI